ncbi:site-specific integrase [Comamonadaceae bacterium M7527]|nr:site-specific integrase [Comamonadaceae bacterium M7527]UFS56111.1 site-specific integrase [Comamonadaceae bacterium M7527]
MAAAKSLTSAELAHTLDYISTRKFAARDRAMLLMMVMSGLRVSEVADLKLCDVRDANGTVRAEIYLGAHRVKHNHARTVYVSTRLQEELQCYINSRKWYEEEQALFTTYSGARKGFSANVLSQHFYWLFKAAGIKGASSHSGRKTFLTSLASQGVSVFVLASLAGHKSIATTQRYITVNDDVKRRAVELV